MKIKNIIISWWQITSQIIFSSKKEVLFYYPQHFNRSANGENTFFKGMIDSCATNGIRYVVIEEPDSNTNAPHNQATIRGDFFLLIVLLIRKTVGLFSNANFVDKRVAKVFDAISFHRFRYDHYISISGSMNELFLEIPGDGQVYEMQHGIIYKGKSNFFDENLCLRPIYQNKKFHWLVNGSGVKRTLTSGAKDNFSDRVHPIGLASVMSGEKIRGNSDGPIVISLQFTEDKLNIAKHSMFIGLLEYYLDILSDSGKQVLLKHHPRYNNSINIDYLLEKYPFVSITTDSIDNLAVFVSYHMTCYSTTAFDFAKYGIPTIIMHNVDFPIFTNILIDTFCYPLFKDDNVEDVVNTPPRLYEDFQIKVQNWYYEYNQEFDKEAFLKLLKL